MYVRQGFKALVLIYTFICNVWGRPISIYDMRHNAWGASNLGSLNFMTLMLWCKPQSQQLDKDFSISKTRLSHQLGFGDRCDVFESWNVTWWWTVERFSISKSQLSPHRSSHVLDMEKFTSVRHCVMFQDSKTLQRSPNHSWWESLVFDMEKLATVRHCLTFHDSRTLLWSPNHNWWERRDLDMEKLATVHHYITLEDSKTSQWKGAKMQLSHQMWFGDLCDMMSLESLLNHVVMMNNGKLNKIVLLLRQKIIDLWYTHKAKD